jgi:hypothetical protein
MATDQDLDLRLDETRRRLLEEGARSYVAANTALIQFRVVARDY